MMAISLRRRLVLTLMSLVLSSWLICVVITGVFAQQTVIQQIDRQLVHYIEVSLHSLGTIYSEPQIVDYYQSNSQRSITELGISRVKGFGSQGRDLATNLWFQGAQVLVGSEAPRFPQPLEDGIVQRELNTAGVLSTWRIIYRHDQALDVWVATGLNMKSVSSLVWRAVLSSILPLLVILPLIIAVLFWGVGRGLRPLEHLAAKIAARQPLALEPIDQQGVPREIRPVVSSLNGLLDRLQRTLMSERRFTSNAAHELQTPLAAIKAEVQRCQRQTPDPDSRRMLERIEIRVTRAAETVSQLLTLARLDPEQQFGFQALALQPLLIEVIAEEGHVAADRQLDVRIESAADVVIDAHEEWIRILVRNLLSNAFKYTSAGGRVHIALQPSADGVCLSIANDCGVISAPERQRLLDRFYSLPGREVGGVGLGLSIVQRIAELHGATITLNSWKAESGFVVKVAFPANLETADV